jgi:thioredoxin-like negative regulator of GroEL
MSVPTILIFKDGKKISEYNGILSEEELGKIIKDISN